MKKFVILPCEKGKVSESYVVGISPYEMEDYVLFFPVNDEDAELINALLEADDLEKLQQHAKTIQIYKTMMDGWESVDVFLSAVILDIEEVEGKESLFCRICLSNIDDGTIVNFSKTTFINGFILACLSGFNIIVTDAVLNKLLPSLKDMSELTNPPVDDKKEEPKTKNKYPVDKKIDKIAKKIMNGKLK